MTTFTDIFKKSFIEGFASSDITLATILASMGITTVLALYIFVVYRLVTRKTFYSKTFNISLAAIAMITAGIIITIQSSIVVSLGMVGALSIVRFRTAVKDPLDLVFLFWSIAVGIICGVGLAETAVILSLAVTVVIIVLDRIPVAKAPLILVVNSCDIESENFIIDSVRKYTKHLTVKSRNASKGSLNLIIELRTDKGNELIKSLLLSDKVISASLLAHDGEVTF